jgi:hypothetical protein
MEVAERVEQAAAFRRLHDPGRGTVRKLARTFLAEGASEPLWGHGVEYGEMNRLLDSR